MRRVRLRDGQRLGRRASGAISNSRSRIGGITATANGLMTSSPRMPRYTHLSMPIYTAVSRVSSSCRRNTPLLLQDTASIAGTSLPRLPHVDGSSTGTGVPRMWAPFEAPTIRRSYLCSRFRQSVSISPSRRCVDAAGQVVLRRQLRRRYALAFFQKLSPCLVGFEACASSHYWSRELQALGRTVRLMPPAYVKPNVKRQKSDTTGAEAICKAVDQDGRATELSDASSREPSLHSPADRGHQFNPRVSCRVRDRCPRRVKFGDQDNPDGPWHLPMRGFDRDLIRGGHYGQRSRVPRKTGRTHGCSDHCCKVKILLANPEPATQWPMEASAIGPREPQEHLCHFGVLLRR
jgi:transposase